MLSPRRHKDTKTKLEFFVSSCLRGKNPLRCIRQLLLRLGFLQHHFFPRAFLVDPEQEFLGVDDVARVAGEVEVLHVHADRVNRAGFGAKTAEAAAEDVDIEPLGEFLDHRVGRFAGCDMDAVARTDGLAEHAGGTAHRAVLLDSQPVSPAPADVYRALDFGVLVGRRGDFAVLFGAEHP